MTRRPFTYTPLATAVQTASLVLVAACVFSILISDIAHQMSALPNGEQAARAQLD
jgi:hypothetical protein